MIPTQKLTFRSGAFVIFVAVLLVFSSACSGERNDSTTPGAAGETVRLQGAGCLLYTSDAADE